MPFKDRKKQLEYLKNWKKKNPDYMKNYLKDYMKDYDTSIPAGVYGIFDVNTSECYYIGQSRQPRRRKSNHFTANPCKETASVVSIKLYEGKIKRNQLEFRMLEFCDITEKRVELETKWIKKLNPIWNTEQQGKDTQ